MTLRSPSGPIEVRLGDLFDYESKAGVARCEVLLAERDRCWRGQPVICCRLLNGAIESEGRTVELAGTLVNIPGDLVGALVAGYRRNRERVL